MPHIDIEKALNHFKERLAVLNDGKSVQALSGVNNLALGLIGACLGSLTLIMTEKLLTEPIRSIAYLISLILLMLYCMYVYADHTIKLNNVKYIVTIENEEKQTKEYIISIKSVTSDTKSEI